ncbi:MAG: BREX system P-loop protein BrxC [Bacteroidales bacterium]|nr:BREX system P-loop protein BrxC [Bacteroidales bacterium]MCF8336430.1 BREX system P-loop protein BrxC [Bacteroidales bacterium]
MEIKNLFSEDINRYIETVIKADDQENIHDEVSEFVVTKEISKKVSEFFTAYNNFQGANGVWISGFFGSGKSHLLKILSYVLENREYEDKKLGEIFAEKIEDDEMLKGDILKATRIPSESILFNIDQQAQITSRNDEEAILNVFYKVLNDHLGYFGSQRHVAEFERWLDNEGVFKEFQEKYEKHTGKFWTHDRRQYFAPRVKDAIGEVLGAIWNDKPEKYRDIIETIRKDINASVEDFCDKVSEYIKTKSKDFRLNFYVDEVGQYISNNTKLMLNLQTIAETLATKTKGHSWIFVTSQEDMEKVVGDMNRSQRNDFSRIQARFKLKIPLTSANVDEVIEKRLLRKKKDKKSVLASIWEKEKASLDTLLSFSDVGVQFRKFQDENDFINKYPFVPYQFDLFQQCIKALSNHNAFQGHHQSVGERSMLGVFQNVVQRIEDHDENTLVSFDLLFEGIRATIRGEIQNAINLAENNLDNDFAIQVLKALFMVKYFDNFKTTERNISTLMIDHTQIDINEHDKKVKEALALLENQTYIQRNGELYEYLTDDEKDIEQEIKNTSIDEQQVSQLFNEIIFDHIIGDTKIKYLENKHEYEYTRKVDGAFFGREKELTIEFITPNFEGHNNKDFFKSQTMGYNTMMMMVIPQDNRLLQDIRMYLKTDKYVKQSQSTTNNDNIKRILFEKQQQNTERRRDIGLLLKKLVAQSDVYLNGQKQETRPATDGKTRVINEFQKLVTLAYPNLKMIGKQEFNEDSVKKIIRSDDYNLFGTDDSSMSEAESEILNLIHRRKMQSDRTTLADVRDSFVKKPYGWYPNAIWSITAKLYKRGKIEMRQEGTLLEDEDAIEALLNNRNHNNTILEPQLDIDPKDLINFYNEIFDEPCPYKEAKDVGIAFKEKLQEELDEVKKILSNKADYEFLKELEPYSEFLERLSKKEYSYFLNHLNEFEDDLLDKKDDLLDPIKKFWYSEQKNIYDSIKKFFTNDQSNLDYIQSEELDTLRKVYNHPQPYKGNLIQNAKAAKDTLTKKMLEMIDQERNQAIKEVEKVIKILKEKNEFSQLSEYHREAAIKPFEEEIEKLKASRFIANIRQTKSYVQNELLERQLNFMVRNIEKEEGKADEDYDRPPVHYVRKEAIKVDIGKNELQNEQDVNEYIEELKKRLLEQIKNNKRITL